MLVTRHTRHHLTRSLCSNSKMDLLTGYYWSNNIYFSNSDPNHTTLIIFQVYIDTNLNKSRKKYYQCFQLPGTDSVTCSLGWTVLFMLLSDVSTRNTELITCIFLNFWQSLCMWYTYSWSLSGISFWLNYRIQGHLFTSHWITKVPIVLCFVLQKIVTHAKQVVRSGPAFCVEVYWRV